MTYYLALVGFILTFLGAILMALGVLAVLYTVLLCLHNEHPRNILISLLVSVLSISVGAVSFFGDQKVVGSIFFVAIGVALLIAGARILGSPVIYSLPVKGNYLESVKSESKMFGKITSSSSYLRFTYTVDEEQYESLSKDDVSTGYAAAYLPGKIYEIWVNPKKPIHFKVDPKNDRGYGWMGLLFGLLMLIAGMMLIK